MTLEDLIAVTYGGGQDSMTLTQQIHDLMVNSEDEEGSVGLAGPGEEN